MRCEPSLISLSRRAEIGSERIDEVPGTTRAILCSLQRGSGSLTSSSALTMKLNTLEELELLSKLEGLTVDREECRAANMMALL